MKKSKQAYAELVKKLSPKSDMAKGVWRAFAVGGSDLRHRAGHQRRFFIWIKMGTQSAATATSICLVFLSALLTGLGVYDRIGKYAGAGSIIPITGFANATVAPAMEFRREGLVMGIGAKIFTLSGPVLVYGIGSSILVGLIAALAGVIG